MGDPFSCRFEVKGPATGDVYQIVQDYSASVVVTWDTTGYVGQNRFRVSVREAGEREDVARRWINAYVNAAGATDDLAVTRAQRSPQLEGMVYQLTAEASGGAGNYEYQFERKGPGTGETYQVVQGYSPQASLAWDTNGYIGQHTFRVSARNAGSTDSPVRRWVRVAVNPVGAVEDLSLARDLRSPQLAGAVYNLSATATGGSGSYEYRFEVRGPATGGVYQVVQDYSALATLVWDTTDHVGQNRLRVFARNAGSADTPVRRSIRADVNPVGAANDVRVTRSLSSPQPEGAVYRFTASASGGSGAYEYRFEVRSEALGGTYQVLQDYSGSDTFDLDTAGRVGENTVRISARNAGSDHQPVRRWRKAHAVSP